VYNSLKFFRDNNLSDYASVIEQYFTTDVNDPYGQLTVDLIINGSYTKVTDDNKGDFIKKKCYYIGYLSIQDQLESMIEGFKSVIELQWIKPFTCQELEQVLCGQQFIDLEDWKNNTELKDFHSYSKTIERFWKCMGTYDQK